MAPLSVVFRLASVNLAGLASTPFRSAQSARALLLSIAAAALAACASDPASSASAKPLVQPKAVCSAPPPIRDIWKLEPMLTENGTITAEMTREQKEVVIRDYIHKKNQAFLNCKENK